MIRLIAIIVENRPYRTLTGSRPLTPGYLVAVGTIIADRHRVDPYVRCLAHTALISDGGGEAWHRVGMEHTRLRKPAGS